MGYYFLTVLRIQEYTRLNTGLLKRKLVTDESTSPGQMRPEVIKGGGKGGNTMPFEVFSTNQSTSYEIAYSAIPE